MINARSLAPKLDELEILLHESSADVAAVSETWLYKDIDSKYLKIQGFNLFRRDRLNGRESGVCVYVSNAIPSKRCNNLASEAFECLWLLLRPYRLPRNITGIIPGILYKPPDKSSEEQHNITDYLLEIWAMFAQLTLTAVLLILDIWNLLRSHSLFSTVVSVPTRESAVFDLIVTNIH